MASRQLSLSSSQGARLLTLAVAFGVVAANLLLSLANAPRFALPARLLVDKRDAADLSSTPASSAGTRRAASLRKALEDAAPTSRHAAAFEAMFAPVAGKQSPSYTREACVAQSDESETCFYSGPLCYDGARVVVAPRPGAAPRGNDPRTSMCYDFRHFVASQSCGYNGPHRRDNLSPEMTVASILDESPGLVVGADTHRWGPIGREVSFREVDAAAIASPAARNLSVTWLDGPLYIAGLHHSWIDHTWHFAAASMALFDIKRHNRTDLSVEGADEGRTLSTAAAWAAPAMEYLLFAGEYRHVAGAKDLRSWIANLLGMLIQNGTEILWNSRWEALVRALPDSKQTRISSEDFGGAKLLCAHSGAVLGLKPRFFNSIGDAHAFRLVAYGLSGVTARAKDDWPPRQITLVTRIGSRALDNIEEVVPVLNSTGLKFEWVQEMGALTFQEQVGVMANTGILVAIHGAGLTNVLFMPAHSVVIEVRL